MHYSRLGFEVNNTVQVVYYFPTEIRVLLFPYRYW